MPENLGFYDNTFVLQAKLQLGLISPAFVTQNTPFLNDAIIITNDDGDDKYYFVY